MTFFLLYIASQAGETMGIPRPVAQKMDTAQASEMWLPEPLLLGKRRDLPAGWEGAGSRATQDPWVLYLWGMRGLFSSISFPSSSCFSRRAACLPRGGQEVAMGEDLGAPCLAAFTRSQLCHHRLT